MTFQSVARAFLKVERDARLCEMRWMGIPIWWFARMRVFSDVFKSVSAIDMGVSRANTLKPSEAVRYLADASRLQRFRPHPILAISTSSARRTRLADLDFDVFYDFLKWTRYHDQYAIFETPDRMRHGKEPATLERYLGDRYLLCANVSRRVGLALHGSRLFPALKEFGDRVYEALKAEGLEIERDKVHSTIYSEAAFAAAAVPYAKHILKRVKPKVLLVQSGAASSRLAFQLAAKRLGIPVVEVQHGLIVDDHPAYFPGVNPPTLGEHPFPDAMWVYGDHFKKLLLKNPLLNEESISIVGSPYFSKEKTKFESNGQRTPGGILITTNPEWADFYCDLVKKLHKVFPSPIYIKPHPSEYDRVDKLYGELAKLKSVTVLPKEVSLYQAFALAEFHISVGSFAILEAIAVGLKNIIVKYAGFEHYVDFLVEQGVPVAGSSEEIVQIVKNYPDTTKVARYVQEEVWTLQSDPIQLAEKTISHYGLN